MTGCANPPGQPVQPSATGAGIEATTSTGGTPQRPLHVEPVKLVELVPRPALAEKAPRAMFYAVKCSCIMPQIERDERS